MFVTLHSQQLLAPAQEWLTITEASKLAFFLPWIKLCEFLASLQNFPEALLAPERAKANFSASCLWNPAAGSWKLWSLCCSDGLCPASDWLESVFFPQAALALAGDQLTVPRSSCLCFSPMIFLRFSGFSFPPVTQHLNCFKWPNLSFNETSVLLQQRNIAEHA